jgi:hypothetical protein
LTGGLAAPYLLRCTARTLQFAVREAAYLTLSLETFTMSTSSLIALACIAVAIVYAIVIYNGFIALKHSVSKSFANIDVLLKQRHAAVSLVSLHHRASRSRQRRLTLDYH